MSEATLKVLIIVPNYWGKGPTISEAWDQVKRASCKNLRELKRGRYQIHVCWDTDEVKTRLDEFGFNVQYPEGYRPVIIETKE